MQFQEAAALSRVHWDRGRFWRTREDERLTILAVERCGRDPGKEVPVMTIGQKIRAWRQRQGWTQEKLAREIGVNRTTISDWELEKYEPNPDHMEKLRRLGVL